MLKGLKLKYGKFNYFIKDSKLFMSLLGNIKQLGYFQPFGDGGDIVFKVDENILYDYIIENHEKYSKEEIKEELYYVIYSSRLISVIRHELQHAYDYYISDGKFNSDKKSKDFYSKRVDNDGEIDPEAKQKQKVKYFRLQHEINARFTQTISELNGYGLVNNDGSMVTLKDYLEGFKKKFLAWDLMTPKIQKYLMRRASQYYHKYKEEYDKEKKEE